MDQEFDPYLELLGIPKSEQPPNCYRLLGIPEYTANKQVIANGAARQMQFLRRVGGDQYLDQVQKILNEISKVRILLLDDEKRDEYDRTLKEKERAKSGKPPGESDSDSLSRSQSQFDLSAPVQRELGQAAPIQLIFLSGPRVGEVISLRSRDVSLGPSSRYDVMLPTRNGASFKLEHEIDQWVLASEETGYAVNGRLINGLTTVKDGDILRFSADGPDLQFIEEVDLTQILKSLKKYESLVASQSNVSNPSFSQSSASHRRSSSNSRRQSTPAQQQRRPARTPQRPAQKPTRPHQSRLVKKPESQRSQGLGGSLVNLANLALGRDKSFTKKTGMAFDWQIGVFWLAVGGTLAAIAALIIFAVWS
jgi:hypothetical protein